MSEVKQPERLGEGLLRRSMPPRWSTTSPSVETWPAWYVRKRAERPPDDCRARCGACSGTGIWDGAQWAIGGCLGCRESVAELPCPTHACTVCRGAGLVCPVCLGFRFVRRDVPVGHPDFGRELRCQACCEGNQVNEVKERRAIARYLASYRPVERQEREAQRREVAAATQREYVARNGDPRARFARVRRPPPRDDDSEEVRP